MKSNPLWSSVAGSQGELAAKFQVQICLLVAKINKKLPLGSLFSLYIYSSFRQRIANFSSTSEHIFPKKIKNSDDFFCDVMAGVRGLILLRRTKSVTHYIIKKFRKAMSWPFSRWLTFCGCELACKCFLEKGRGRESNQTHLAL